MDCLDEQATEMRLARRAAAATDGEEGKRAKEDGEKEEGVPNGVKAEGMKMGASGRSRC